MNFNFRLTAFSWKAMAAALEKKGYDYQFTLGEGSHSARHGTALFPDVMRWMWRDYPKD